MKKKSVGFTFLGAWFGLWVILAVIYLLTLPSIGYVFVLGGIILWDCSKVLFDEAGIEEQKENIEECIKTFRIDFI